MITNYKFWKENKTGQNTCLQTFSNGSWDNYFIPLDPDNSDYEAYLEWVAAGNTAVAAD